MTSPQPALRPFRAETSRVLPAAADAAHGLLRSVGLRGAPCRTACCCRGGGDAASPAPHTGLYPGVVVLAWIPSTPPQDSGTAQRGGPPGRLQRSRHPCFGVKMPPALCCPSCNHPTLPRDQGWALGTLPLCVPAGVGMRSPPFFYTILNCTLKKPHKTLVTQCRNNCKRRGGWSPWTTSVSESQGLWQHLPLWDGARVPAAARPGALSSAFIPGPPVGTAEATHSCKGRQPHPRPRERCRHRQAGVVSGWAAWAHHT